MDVINEIKNKIKSRGITQKEFAELIDMHPSKLSDVLNGRRPLRLEFITACAKVFPEINLERLIQSVHEQPEVYERTSEVIIREIRLLIDELHEKLKNVPKSEQ